MYRAALKVDPSLDAAKTNLAIAYFQTGDCSNAALWFEKVLGSNPADRRSRQLLGACQLQLGRFSEAAQSFESLLPSSDVSILLGAATAWLKTQRVAEATELLDRIVKQHGSVPEVQLVFGMAQFGSGDYDSAASAFERVLAAEPANPDARFYLGAVFFKRKQFDAAIREWRETARSASGHFSAVFALGALEGEQGRLEEALLWLEKAAELRPDNGAVHFELGKVAARGKHYPLALKHLEIASKLNPQSKTVSYLMAQVLRSMGQSDRARAEFERGRNLPEEGAADFLDQALGAPASIARDRRP